MLTFADVFAFFCKILTKNWDCRAVQKSALCRSRRELSNEYLLAKFGFDTAENEPCQVSSKSIYHFQPRCASAVAFAIRAEARSIILWDPAQRRVAAQLRGHDEAVTADHRLDRANLTGLVLGCIEAKFCKKICVGKLSPRFTQCTPLHSSVIAILSKICQFLRRILQNSAN